jgi:hypothetical protein
MNAKERSRIQAAHKDAQEKIKLGTGKNSKDYYQGIIDVLHWVLVEV